MTFLCGCQIFLENTSVAQGVANCNIQLIQGPCTNENDANRSQAHDHHVAKKKWKRCDETLAGCLRLFKLEATCISSHSTHYTHKLLHTKHTVFYNQKKACYTANRGSDAVLLFFTLFPNYLRSLIILSNFPLLMLMLGHLYNGRPYKDTCFSSDRPRAHKSYFLSHPGKAGQMAQ